MGSIRRPPASASVPASPDAGASPNATQRCDVLVVGGSSGGMQAAGAAAAAGARVVLIDSGTPVDLQALDPSAGLGDVRWLQGHSALELLLDAAGGVRGAAGVQGPAETPWRIEAGAVVIATREALLMAAEAGAQLSGMEDGHGGLRLRDEGPGGASTVDGLYAVGEAACSALPPGVGLPRGTQALALWSGQQAGAAAAAEAQAYAPAAPLRHAGVAGLCGSGHRPANPAATLAALQAILNGLGQGWRDDEHTAEALTRLDALWHFLCHAAPAPQGARCASRAAASRLALARWQLRSQLARRASEAAHQADEWVVSGGLDQVWAQTESRQRRANSAAAFLPPVPVRLNAFAR